MIVLASDPGLRGAIAAVCDRRGLLEVASIPTCSNGAGPTARVRTKVDARALRELLAAWSTRHEFAREHVIGVVERMQPFSRAGEGGGASPVTLLSMGHSAGVIEGVLEARCREVLQPLPQQWKRAFGLGSDKSKSLEAARRLFPHDAARIKRHDLAEAALLGSWALGLRSQGSVAEPAEDHDPELDAIFGARAVA